MNTLTSPPPQKLVKRGAIGLHRIMLFSADPVSLQQLCQTFEDPAYVLLASNNTGDIVHWAKHESPEVFVCSIAQVNEQVQQLLETVEEQVPFCSRIALCPSENPATSWEILNSGRVNRVIQTRWDLELQRNLLAEMACLAQLNQQRHQISDHLLTEVGTLSHNNLQLNRVLSRQHKDLNRARQMLQNAEYKHQLNLVSAVKALTRVMNLYNPELMAHGRRVAELARLISGVLGLSTFEVRQLHLAGLLHDIGKVGIDLEILGTPFSHLDGAQQHLIQQHPLRGAESILEIPDLAEIAALIKHHHERMDGQGFPDGLIGNQIPMGARILAVAEDFDELCSGYLTLSPIGKQEAAQFILGAAGTRYDTQVTAALPEALKRLNASPRTGERKLPVHEINEGMTLTRDLVGSEGLLIQSAGRQVSSSLIRHLQEREARLAEIIQVYVRK